MANVAAIQGSSSIPYASSSISQCGSFVGKLILWLQTDRTTDAKVKVYGTKSLSEALTKISLSAEEIFVLPKINNRDVYLRTFFNALVTYAAGFTIAPLGVIFNGAATIFYIGKYATGSRSEDTNEKIYKFATGLLNDFIWTLGASFVVFDLRLMKYTVVPLLTPLRMLFLNLFPHNLFENIGYGNEKAAYYQSTFLKSLGIGNENQLPLPINRKEDNQEVVYLINNEMIVKGRLMTFYWEQIFAFKEKHLSYLQTLSTYEIGMLKLDFDMGGLLYRDLKRLRENMPVKCADDKLREALDESTRSLAICLCYFLAASIVQNNTHGQFDSLTSQCADFAVPAYLYTKFNDIPKDVDPSTILFNKFVLDETDSGYRFRYKTLMPFASPQSAYEVLHNRILQSDSPLEILGYGDLSSPTPEEIITRSRLLSNLVFPEDDSAIDRWYRQSLFELIPCIARAAIAELKSRTVS
ncbi:MAG: hypothetical protein WC222_07800 [Parachlamydiales bacterium]|jgi:hypothetical protein